MNKELDEIYEYRGVEDLVAAEVLQDNNKEGEGYKTGEVFAIAGVAEIGKNTANSSEPHYYNNIPAVVVTSVGADTITCSTSAIPLDVLGKITGQNYDEETGTLIEGERETKYFALGYKTKKTNGQYMYVWRLKGTFNIPDSNHATENDGTDANGQEVTFTGINTTHKFDKVKDKYGNKKGAKAINVDLEKNLADVSTFFDEVTTPDTLKKKSKVEPIKVSVPSAETSLNLGEKTVQDLCENLNIDEEGNVTGSLKHIDNWTEFSKTDNSGNFIPLYFEEAKGQPKGTIKCELKGTGAKLKKPVAVDEKDGLIVFQVHNQDNTIEITSEGKETKTLNLSKVELKTE